MQPSGEVSFPFINYVYQFIIKRLNLCLDNWATINLPEINTLYDHRTGNKVLKDFSGILSTAAVSLCFVGRNGGNKFLAIFENCTDEKLNTFLDRVTDRVDQYNQASDSISMEYRIGKAMNRDEHLEQITKLISLANSRIPKSATVERSWFYGYGIRLWLSG